MKVKKLLMAVIVAGWFGAVLTSIGCNTVHGLGRDIERGGEKTQDAADAVKRRL